MGYRRSCHQGLTPYQILTRYYGEDLDIRTAPTRPAVRSYPGQPLRLGDASISVEIMQSRLNRISNNYPAIPKIYPVNGVFDANTESAVKAFQEIFNLTPDGIVGPATWYQITSVYNAVLRLAELNAIGITLQDISRTLPEDLREGMRGDPVRLLQFFLSTIGRFQQRYSPCQNRRDFRHRHTHRRAGLPAQRRFDTGRHRRKFHVEQFDSRL